MNIGTWKLIPCLRHKNHKAIQELQYYYKKVHIIKGLVTYMLRHYMLTKRF